MTFLEGKTKFLVRLDTYLTTAVSRFSNNHIDKEGSHRQKLAHGRLCLFFQRPAVITLAAPGRFLVCDV